MKPHFVTLLAATATAAVALSGCPARDAKNGARDIDNVTAMQCRTEFRNMQTALEAYSLLENKIPTSELEMVPLYLHIESPFYDISPTGQVVPAPGTNCK